MIAFLTNIQTLSWAAQSLLLQTLPNHPENSSFTLQMFPPPVNFVYESIEIPTSSPNLWTPGPSYTTSHPNTSCLGDNPCCGVFSPCINPVKLWLNWKDWKKVLGNFATTRFEPWKNCTFKNKSKSGCCKRFVTPAFILLCVFFYIAQPGANRTHVKWASPPHRRWNLDGSSAKNMWESGYFKSFATPASDILGFFCWYHTALTHQDTGKPCVGTAKSWCGVPVSITYTIKIILLINKQTERTIYHDSLAGNTRILYKSLDITR